MVMKGVLMMMVMVFVVMAMVVMVVVAIVNDDGVCGDSDGLSKERVE